jgi:hypothetical protein
VDIKGHDGVIYKGRLDADKLPAVNINKKNSVVLLAPPGQRSRLDSLPMSTHHQRELTGNDQERNGLSSFISNIEPALPREESFT